MPEFPPETSEEIIERIGDRYPHHRNMFTGLSYETLLDVWEIYTTSTHSLEFDTKLQRLWLVYKIITRQVSKTPA